MGLSPRVRPAATLAATLALTATGCSLGGGEGDIALPVGRDIHDDREGPLSISSPAGVELSLARPDGESARWSGSFGGMFMCAWEPNHDLVIEDVRVDTGRRAPHRTRAFVRTVAPDQVAGGETGPAMTGFSSALGAAPDFDEDYARTRYGGRYTAEPGGTTIDQDCPQEPGDGFTELVLTLTTGPEGGEVKQVLVDYTVDGKPAHRGGTQTAGRVRVRVRPRNLRPPLTA